jgi:hypothetical protein
MWSQIDYFEGALERDAMDNSSGGLAGVVGGVILVMVALCFPFVLLGIGIIVIALALVPGLFKRNKKALNGKGVIVYHYKPSPPE